MKHLTTLITTLLLSLITTPMSADTGGTYQLVPKDYTFQEGDIIIIASYDKDNEVQYMTYNSSATLAIYKFYCFKNTNPESVSIREETTQAGLVYNITMPSSIELTEVNTDNTPVELYVSNPTATTVALRKHNSTGDFLKRSNSNSDLEWSQTSFYWQTNITTGALGTIINGTIFSIQDRTSNLHIRAYKSSAGFLCAQAGIGNKYNIAVCYKKVIPTATVPYTISSYGYSTLYYSDKSLILPEGLKAYTYTIEDGNLKVLETFDGSSEEESNRIVPRGAAVMVKGAPGEYELVETTADAYNNPRNMLAGTDNAEETTGGSKYYMLSVGKIGLGFYWGADDGAAFTNGAHKAYLRIPAGSSAKALHFSLPDDDMPTAIATSSATKPALTTPSYNLQGINASTTHSGIVISNGKKIIRK